MQKPNKVILHVSDTPDYPKGHPAFDLIKSSDIDEWHRKRGFRMIGYQWVVRQSGWFEIGRKETEVGAHTRGHNTGSIGICLVGTMKINANQWDALEALYHRIRDDWGITWRDWYGHHEFTNAKTCPNQSMDLVRAWLRNSI